MRSDVSNLRDAQADAGASQAADGVNRDVTQYLVPPAMLVVAVAMAVAGQLHLGLSAEIATAVGVALFCLMLMCHVLLGMADAAERAAEEAAERGIGQVASPMPATPPADTMSAEAAVGDEGAPGWGFRPVDLKQPEGAEADADGDRTASDPRSFGEFRPTYADHRPDAAADPAGGRLSLDREADRIDTILKRLANQIHAGAAERQQAVEPASPSLPAMPEPVMTAPGMAGDQRPLEELAAENPDSALACAVDALRSTVEAMRGAPQPEASGPSPAEVSVAAVAEAIQAESADVFLSPILGLAEQSARHFEVSVKLRVDTGDERSVAAGVGLLPLLDALSVRHATGFALMLERRGREGAVFSRIGGKSLESDRFVADVAGRHAQGVADRMVLSFAQDEMRGLGPAQLAALGDLARLGFRFALQGVADLDMDFEALQALGFEFVKLDAAVFQAGLFCDGETVPAGDICDHFQDLGLSVIVGDIADAETRDRLLGWGVVYGQGALFGPPRPVAVAPSASGTIAA